MIFRPVLLSVVIWVWLLVVHWGFLEVRPPLSRWRLLAKWTAVAMG
jgi:hypothetical protein